MNRRKALQIRLTVLSSNMLICSLASRNIHTAYAMWWSKWAPHPTREASAVMVACDGGRLKRVPIVILDRSYHQMREAKTGTRTVTPKVDTVPTGFVGEEKPSL